jgi:phage N-6-adenine-methyltransferase
MTRPDDHRTPRDFFDGLSERYGPFDLDVAASDENALTIDYFTRDSNALFRDWDATNVWCNPPYAAIDAWVDYALIQLSRGMCYTVTMLLPVRPDRPWFERIWRNALHIDYVRGRIKFEGPHCVGSSPFPVMVVHLDASCIGMPPTVGFIDRQGKQLKEWLC